MKEISPAESPENLHIPHQLPPPSLRKKKTREFPNMSNCNGCDRRVNDCTNPQDRLQTLRSEWRIVLLCNSCYCLVESSQICSYCLTNFRSVSADSTLDCKICRRRIHRNCVSMFASGSGVGDDFCVCFDCWVPKLVENDYVRVCETRFRKRAKKEVRVCVDSMSMEGFRVCDSNDNSKFLEELVNDGNAVVQKKIIVALEAEEKAVDKAMRARRVVEVAGGALDFVAVDRGGGASRGGLAVDDDAQLAIKLHRAMNSSSRIATNSCLLTKDSVNLSAVNVNGNFEALRSQSAEKICPSKVIDVENEVNTRDTRTLLYREKSGLCSAETKEGFVPKTYVSQDNKSKLASNSNACLITYSRKRRASPDGRSKKENTGLLRMYRRRLSHVERCKVESDVCLKTYHRRRLSHVERRKMERDVYFKTYRRRLSTMKLLHGGFNLEHEILAPTLALNCCKEPRVCTDAS